MSEDTDVIPFHQRLRLERYKRDWSQERLAEELNVNPRTVRRWETGQRTPPSAKRKQLCLVLGLTPEELGFEPNTPHLEDALRPPKSSGQRSGGDEFAGAYAGEEQESFLPPVRRYEVPLIPLFAGRKKELTELRNWILADRCKLIALLGIGGVGKTTLAATLAKRVRTSFSTVFWGDLVNAPPLKQLLPQCIQAISGRVYTTLPQELEEQISLLLDILQQKRCLLVLDNMESLMQSEQNVGFFLPGYESYGTLIRLIGESQHQSCLVITSREKPDEVALLEGPHSSVRSFDLSGVDMEAGRELLQNRGFKGSDQEWGQLVERYSGNPLALRLVADLIHTLFGRSIKRFLSDGSMLFNTMNHLLHQQVSRLSAQEYALLCWLAIEREPVSHERLRENLLLSVSKGAVLGDLNKLKRRSMIEVYSDSTFILQPVIMEYITVQLIESFVKGFPEGVNASWAEYALMKAQVPEYVRESQERFLLAPVAERLLERYNKTRVLQIFQEVLSTERRLRPQQHNYLAANILHLLGFIKADLRGLDCSELVIWQANLQAAFLPGTNFTQAAFIGSSFVNMSGNALSVAFSPTGKLLAIGTVNDIWLYESKSGAALFTYQGHTDSVWSVSFSPNGKRLVSSSDDGTIRIWDTQDDHRSIVLRDHSERVKAVAFSPKGKVLVSGSNDRTARIWSAKSGECSHILTGHTGRVWAVAVSPDGQMVATGSTDQSIRLWNMGDGSFSSELTGHKGWVLGLAFSPDGKWLASSGDDCTIRLWNLVAPAEVRVLEGHEKRVRSLSFHRDGLLLASGSEDRTVRVWDVQTGETLEILKGHLHGVRSVAFDPRTHVSVLASGGDDQTTRIWDVENGRCLKTIQGYTNRIWIIAFSPDGKMVVSGSEDQKVRLWRTDGETQPREMQEPGHAFRSLAYSRDGRYVATGGEDQTIRVWEAASGLCVKTLREHKSWIRAVAFSPDGKILASGGEDNAIMLWKMSDGTLYKQFIGHENWIRSLAFSPDGKTLASGSDDKTIRLWSISLEKEVQVFRKHTGQVRTIAYSPDGKWLASGGEDNVMYLWNPETEEVREFLGHDGWVRSMTFSPDGKRLVSGSEDQSVRLWDVESGMCLRVLLHHSDRVRSVAFSPLGQVFASSSDDGKICLWDAQSGDFLKFLRSERPYEGMLIRDAEGLTDAQRQNLKLLGALEEKV